MPDCRLATMTVVSMAVEGARLGIFEDHRAAQVFKRHRVTDKAKVCVLHGLARHAAPRAVTHEGDEMSELVTRGAAQHIAHATGENHVVDDATDGETEQHLADARPRGIEDTGRVVNHGDGDDRRGIATQDEGVRLEIAVQRGAAGTQADPEGECDEEEIALLRERRDDGDGRRGPG